MDLVFIRKPGEIMKPHFQSTSATASGNAAQGGRTGFGQIRSSAEARNPEGAAFPKIKVAILDGESEFGGFLRVLIGGTQKFLCVGTYLTTDQALRQVSEDRPDVLVIDPPEKLTAADLVHELKRKLPLMEILVLTATNEPQMLFETLRAGATGYLLKSAEPARILEAIDDVHNGGAPLSGEIARLLVTSLQKRGSRRAELNSLTPREQQILELVANGDKLLVIASKLAIHERTVSTHLHNIYRKLKVHSRSEAAAKFWGYNGPYLGAP